ncbi:MAG: hypothetical protein CVV30_06440 [Methanomicrobiales archaeon HGW-Methanomicrobiales-1]|nr:MAG: hypothetical protein CVV30_06440 [Methanomicrobiales archaeon HGW-Methanomicrobiales-1]
MKRLWTAKSLRTEHSLSGIRLRPVLLAGTFEKKLNVLNIRQVVVDIDPVRAISSRKYSVHYCTKMPDCTVR